MNSIFSPYNFVYLAFFLVFISCGSAEENTSTETIEVADNTLEKFYQIDTNLSEITWTGTMVGMYEHTGKLKVASGDFTMLGGELMTGELVIDLNSMSTSDENYSEDKSSEMLIQHLKSADFFDVETSPKVIFKLLSHEKGELTIKGIAQSYELLDMVVTPNGENIMIQGTLSFDRNHFNVSFKHPLKENVINDEVQCGFKIIGIPKG